MFNSSCWLPIAIVFLAFMVGGGLHNVANAISELAMDWGTIPDKDTDMMGLKDHSKIH